MEGGYEPRCVNIFSYSLKLQGALPIIQSLYKDKYIYFRFYSEHFKTFLNKMAL